MANLFCLSRARGGVAVVLSTLCLALFARPACADDRGRSTAEYWNKVKTILQEEEPAANATLEEKISGLQNAARRIDDLSARGVDEEAVDVADKMVELLNRAAAYLDDYGTPERGFKSGFRDGLNNNPTRAIDEQQAIKDMLEEMKQAESKARKHLEARYNIDLPSLK